MKTVCFAILGLRARIAGLSCWRMYWAQKKHNARLAAYLEARAEHWRSTAEYYESLDRLFPLGYSNRWTRRAAQ